VRFFGAPFDAVRQRVGYVPQRETVDWDFPVTAIDVVLMGTYGRLGWIRRPGPRERALARECLDRVGLVDVADRQIGRLSGGQQQRVFLARALAQQADVYLLDEPLAGVDVRSQERIFAVLAGLRAEGRLVVVVHHDLRTAVEWFDRVALIDMRLVAAGPTAQVLTPENLRRTYAGQLDVLDELGRAVAARGRTS
jgi:manganese/zinc/iron transport system ATP- binding protein